ncbi:D-alanyl-D-alanine carboxypeptidase [Streptomyces flavofungini]|uniref:D-alanyl-D-alanine carboxypeptidase n=1 Tax=Streptomyces flavofungini TaxID=68200 RepID=UPI0025B026A9|nr:D-alanyl-D-alanine carboxypeptidase [Streptomyces flavofungini]WJV48101.1 D-alanyl-D-alanine carboxypeptidase [Streptomyces flavofungini]
MVGRGEYGKYEEASVAGEFPDGSKTVSGGGASDGADDASSASGAAVGSTPGDAKGDARLRAAVAAWVAGSEETGTGAESGAGSGAGSEAGAAEAGEGSGAAQGEGSSSGEPEGSSSGAAESADGAAMGDDAEVAGSAVDMATAVFTAARPGTRADDTRDGTEGDDGARAGGGKSEGAKSEADDSASGDDTDDAEAEDPRVDRATAVFTTVRPGVNGKSDAAPKADTEPESATEPDSDADPEPAAETEPEAETEPKPDAEADPAPRAPAKSDATLTLTAKADAKPGGKPEAEREPHADAERKPEVEREPEADAEPKGDDAKPKADDKPKAGDKPKADGKSKADDEPDAPSGPLDQATAVFKAVRPGSAGVDQPTTMLKLGDVPAERTPKSGDAAKPAAKSAAAESESERTSKFVALKPLDEPRVKPEPQAQPAPGAKPGAQGKAAPAWAAAQPSAPAGTPEQASPGAGTPTGTTPPGDRTSQQPVPPLPPLDLLAELTNTPPPPETPTRTIVRRVKIWTPLVVLLAIVFAVAQALRPLPEPKLTLTAATTHSFEGGKPSIPWPKDGQAAMDVDGIGSFGSSGDQKPVPIASIAKVMTTYLILRDHPIKKGGDGKTIEVDAEAQRHYEKGKPANESVVKVTKGQKLTQYEALQAVMLPSANNVARLLARWDSKGSEEKFVAKMNKTAKELGMKNTTYTDPSGLDKTTVSTAEDLVKLGRVAMENPTFKEIAGQRSYEDINGDKQDNYFGLVPTIAIGIKTGTTSAAGGNILFAAEKRVGGKTHMVIGAALAQFGSNGVANIDLVTNVTKDLIAAGQDALKAKTVVKKGEVVGEVDDGLGGTTPVVATKDVTAVGWSGLTVKTELSDGGKTPPHSAKAGTVVGRLLVGDGTTSGAVKVPVALQKDLSEPGFTAKLTRVS